MGCWGITALESDNGLDAVRCVRYNLPADGQLDLGEMLERLKKDRWNAPCDVKLGCAHTSPMALAEIVVKYYEILTKQFIHRFNSTEKELLDELNMERSVFYDRKREAIFLLSLCLFGYAVPELQEELEMPRLYPD